MEPPVIIETLGAKTLETEDGLRKINNYLLKKEIGHGAFGTVHLGVNTLTNQEYAIKEFSKSRLRRKEQLAMMRRKRKAPSTMSTNSLDLVRSELAILKKLSHRNVIRLYEVLDDPDNDSLYMVMEMAHKGVIMQIDINRTATPYTEKTARFYFRQMILGIEYLHFNDIAHRDIKPDNLLLSDNNTLKIVDFGVSEMFIKGNDALTSAAGSPAFMPPESSTLANGNISGKAADIWSMGVTLYCLVHGRVPFANDNVLELHEMIETQEAQFNKNLSSNLIDVLQKLLEKDPAKRITMHELREHSWVTDNGKEPMVVEADNCHSVIVTDEDINSAITSIRHIFTVMQAVAKFRRHSRSLSNSNMSTYKSSPKTRQKQDDHHHLALPQDNIVSFQDIQPIVIHPQPLLSTTSTLTSTADSESCSNV